MKCPPGLDAETDGPCSDDLGTRFNARSAHGGFPFPERDFARDWLNRSLLG